MFILCLYFLILFKLNKTENVCTIHNILEFNIIFFLKFFAVFETKNVKKEVKNWNCSNYHHIISCYPLGISGDQQAFAFEVSHSDVKKEYIDFQKYTGNRLLVFNDTQVDYCITDNDQRIQYSMILQKML